MNLDREGCRDLVLAVFRLAVCDYLGQRYGHDGPMAPCRLTALNVAVRSEAEAFLGGAWAGELAEMAGFSGTEVSRRLRLGTACSGNPGSL